MFLNYCIALAVFLSSTPDEVVKAFNAPGCPALFSMLSPEFQKALPQEKWPQFCQSVGQLSNIEKKASQEGWEVFKAKTPSGFVELALAMNDQGAVAGLSIKPWQEQVTYEAKSLKPLLSEVIEKRKVPAIAALVLKNGSVETLETAGVRKIGSPILATKDDIWHLGSNTKAMTAVLAAVMVDAGKWKWNMTVPELFPGNSAIHEKFKTVTLDLLLQHRSGMMANIPKESWTKPPETLEKAHTDRKYLIDALLQVEPSERGNFLYSNVGYMVVGAALEQWNRLPWEKLIKKQLFDKLKMKSCGFGPSGTVGKIDQPYPHQISSGALVPVELGPSADNTPALGPAGTVHCSLRDWAKFVKIFVTGNSQGLISSNSLEHLITPNGDYAGGWLLRQLEWGAKPALVHSGSNTMNYATVWVFPAEKTAFLAATNVGIDEVGGAALKDVLSFLAKTYLPKSVGKTSSDNR